MKFVESQPLKSAQTYVVRATWDDEAKVWVAASDDVPGLVAEASSVEKLIKKLRALVPEMLEANGVSAPPTYQVRLVAQYQERVTLPA
jgi:predicted RNase H-like HicB family nuclease